MDGREQDALYEQATTGHGFMIRRLTRGYEAEPERRRDLLQDIHLDRAVARSWPFIITGLLLVLVWLAFGLAAGKAARELDELRRRTQD